MTKAGPNNFGNSAEDYSDIQGVPMLETLGMLTLGSCDLPTMVWSVAIMLRFAALRVDRRTKSIPIYAYIYTVVSVACYFHNSVLSMVWFVFVRSQETGDVLGAVLVLTLATTSMIGITKVFFMYFYQDKIQSMVAGYLAYDAAAPPHPVLSATLRNVKKRALLFELVMIGNGIVYNFKPVLTPGRHSMYENQVLFGFEPMFETPNYEITLAVTITSVTFVALTASTITCLLITTAGYTEGRMLALGHDLQNLWAEAQHYYRENFDLNYDQRKVNKNAATELNKYVKQQLQLIARSHSTNIDLIKQTENIFREAIAVEFVLLSISLIADLLIGLENALVLIPFAMMQVGMDCYTGQKLMDASETFERAVYDCKWENFDASNMKMVKLMLQVSQKTLTLSAGGVATLSFGCFMSLIRCIYSAYTTLRSTVR